MVRHNLLDWTALSLLIISGILWIFMAFNINVILKYIGTCFLADIIYILFLLSACYGISWLFRKGVKF